MSSRQGVLVPSIIALAGGLIIMVFSFINLVWFGSGAPSWGGIGEFISNLIGSYHDFMGSYADSTGFFTAVSAVSLACGIVVLMSALVLLRHPPERALWGVVIVVFSAVSFVGMGGFFVGAIFGIVGGVVALRYKPIATS
jgi:hypothetical protein